MAHRLALAFVSQEKWQKRPEEGHQKKTGGCCFSTGH